MKSTNQKTDPDARLHRKGSGQEAGILQLGPKPAVAATFHNTRRQNPCLYSAGCLAGGGSVLTALHSAGPATPSDWRVSKPVGICFISSRTHRLLSAAIPLKISRRTQSHRTGSPKRVCMPVSAPFSRSILYLARHPPKRTPPPLTPPVLPRSLRGFVRLALFRAFGSRGRTGGELRLT
jgi:hypothetical protein